jgi:20S proteasome subunit alpha 5
MYQSANEYDRNVNTFSPDGRLLQVEYAIEAVKLGSSAIAILCPEGVIFAVEKRLSSPLLIPSSIEKVYTIDDHIGVVMSGLPADGRITCEWKCRTTASRLGSRSGCTR